MRKPANTPSDDFPRIRDEGGVAMVEYALILFLIAVVAFGLVGAVGNATLDLYSDIGNAVHEIFG